MGCAGTPYGLSIIHGLHWAITPRKWSNMSRSSRKEFHRKNAARARKGLPLLVGK